MEENVPSKTDGWFEYRYITFNSKQYFNKGEQFQYIKMKDTRIAIT